MAAYDLLAQNHEAMGQQLQAKKILEDAVAISPHMVRRLRHLGGIAFDTGDIGAAERAYKQVVTKAKYSEFRDPEDHVNLVKTLVKKGDAPQASGVLRDMERSLRGGANVEACRAISAAMLHELSGNDIAAASELQLAAAALDTARGPVDPAEGGPGAKLPEKQPGAGSVRRHDETRQRSRQRRDDGSGGRRV